MKRPFKNKQEAVTIRNMDNLRLYDELMPAIRQVAIHGGGAEQILKRSEVLAVMKIAELMGSLKEEVALKAAIEVANRSLGKPVERTINMYGNLSQMNETDIDNQIKRLIKKTGTDQLVEMAAAPEQPPMKVKQRRKPRKQLMESTLVEPTKT